MTSSGARLVRVASAALACAIGMVWTAVPAYAGSSSHTSTVLCFNTGFGYYQINFGATITIPGASGTRVTATSTAAVYSNSGSRCLGTAVSVNFSSYTLVEASMYRNGLFYADLYQSTYGGVHSFTTTFNASPSGAGASWANVGWFAHGWGNSGEDVSKANQYSGEQLG